MKKKPVDASTEEKIKRAAKEVFHRKGYAATRTRDIAVEAGINLALLNYYFRSKEKLFQLIMFETLQGFASTLAGEFNNPDNSFIEKVELITSRYIDMLILEPDVPLFLLSELRNQPDVLLSKLAIKKMVTQSIFAIQYKECVNNGLFPDIPLVHFISNMMGLTIFPFLSSPIFRHLGNLNEEQFKQYMLERKKWIPLWINSILNTPINK